MTFLVKEQKNSTFSDILKTLGKGLYIARQESWLLVSQADYILVPGLLESGAC